jgi:hypothetical protein
MKFWSKHGISRLDLKKILFELYVKTNNFCSTHDTPLYIEKKILFRASRVDLTVKLRNSCSPPWRWALINVVLPN